MFLCESIQYSTCFKEIAYINVLYLTNATLFMRKIKLRQQLGRIVRCVCQLQDKHVISEPVEYIIENVF